MTAGQWQCRLWVGVWGPWLPRGAPAGVWFQVRKPFWTRRAFSFPEHSAVPAPQREPSRAQPAERWGENSPLLLRRLGRRRPWARLWADQRAGCRQSCWKMQLTHILSSRNTSFLMAWQPPVPKGPAVPRPGGGAAFGGLLNPLRCPWAQAGWSVSPVLSPRALDPILGSCGAALERTVPCGGGQLCRCPRPCSQTPCPQAETWSSLGNRTARHLGRHACPWNAGGHVPAPRQAGATPGTEAWPSVPSWGGSFSLAPRPILAWLVEAAWRPPLGGLPWEGPSSGLPSPPRPMGPGASRAGQPRTRHLCLVLLTAEPRAGHTLQGASPRALETGPSCLMLETGARGSRGLSPVRGPDPPSHWSPGLVRSQMGVGGSSQASRAPRLPLTVSACFSSDQLSPQNLNSLI